MNNKGIVKYTVVNLVTDADRAEFDTEQEATETAWDAWGENINVPWGVLKKNIDGTGEWVVLVFGDDEWRPS